MPIVGPILRREFAARLVAEVKRLAPDLIALTGDLVDGSVRQLWEASQDGGATWSVLFDGLYQAAGDDG